MHTFIAYNKQAFEQTVIETSTTVLNSINNNNNVMLTNTNTFSFWLISPIAVQT